MLLSSCCRIFHASSVPICISSRRFASNNRWYSACVKRIWSKSNHSLRLMSSLRTISTENEIISIFEQGNIDADIREFVLRRADNLVLEDVATLFRIASKFGKPLSPAALRTVAAIKLTKVEAFNTTVSTILYSMKDYKGVDASTMEAILSMVEHSLLQLNRPFNGMGVSKCMFGLQRCSSELPVVRRILKRFTTDLSLDTTKLNAQSLGNILYGMQSMSSDHSEVVELIEVLRRKTKEGVEDEMTLQNITMALKGLRGKTTEHRPVRGVVSFLRKQLENNLNGGRGARLLPLQFRNAMQGLTHMSSGSAEVANLLLALTEAVERELQRGQFRLDHFYLGDVLQGLQSMHPQDKEVNDLVTVLNTVLGHSHQHHESASPEGATALARGLGSLCVAWQHHLQNHREVRTLVNNAINMFELATGYDNFPASVFLEVFASFRGVPLDNERIARFLENSAQQLARVQGQTDNSGTEAGTTENGQSIQSTHWRRLAQARPMLEAVSQISSVAATASHSILFDELGSRINLAEDAERNQTSVSNEDMVANLLSLRYVTGRVEESQIRDEAFRLFSTSMRKSIKTSPPFTPEEFSKILFAINQFPNPSQEINADLSTFLGLLVRKQQPLFRPAIKKKGGAVDQETPHSMKQMNGIQIAHVLHALKVMNGYDYDVRQLIGTMVQYLNASSKTTIPSTHVGAALYGLRHLHSEQDGVPALLAAVTSRLHVSPVSSSDSVVAPISPVTLCLALAGLQEMDGSRAESQALLEAVMSREISTSGWEELTLNELSLGLGGLQNWSSNVPAVRKLLPFLTAALTAKTQFAQTQVQDTTPTESQRKRLYESARLLKSEHPEVNAYLLALAQFLASSEVEKMKQVEEIIHAVQALQVGKSLEHSGVKAIFDHLIQVVESILDKHRLDRELTRVLAYNLHILQLTAPSILPAQSPNEVSLSPLQRLQQAVTTTLAASNEKRHRGSSVQTPFVHAFLREWEKNKGKKIKPAKTRVCRDTYKPEDTRFSLDLNSYHLQCIPILAYIEVLSINGVLRKVGVEIEDIELSPSERHFNGLRDRLLREKLNIDVIRVRQSHRAGLLKEVLNDEAAEVVNNVLRELRLI